MYWEKHGRTIAFHYNLIFNHNIFLDFVGYYINGQKHTSAHFSTHLNVESERIQTLTYLYIYYCYFQIFWSFGTVGFKQLQESGLQVTLNGFLCGVQHFASFKAVSWTDSISLSLLHLHCPLCCQWLLFFRLA